MLAVDSIAVQGNGGLSITIGSKSRTDITSAQETRQASTSVGSQGGDVLATAGGSYLQLSSDLTAPLGDIHIAAQNITLQSNNNTRSDAQHRARTAEWPHAGRHQPAAVSGAAALTAEAATELRKVMTRPTWVRTSV